VRQVLPELLRDLGAPFPAVWTQLIAAYGPRDAARVLAKVLGHLETRGAAVVVPLLLTALADGTSVLLALAVVPVPHVLPADAVPLAWRDIDIGQGCAADYDAWLPGGAQ
jgi:hypothetical protein